MRYQKFNNHLRLRPEALAARIHRAGNIEAEFPVIGTPFSDLRASIAPTVTAVETFNGAAGDATAEHGVEAALRGRVPADVGVLDRGHVRAVHARDVDVAVGDALQEEVPGHDPAFRMTAACVKLDRLRGR